MEKKTVSIIVPIYNCERYIEECIHSALSQSYRNIELILVNDGSSDASDQICNKYIHLSNVRYIEQTNKGVSAARREGVEKSTGEWITFLDADDYYLTNDAIQLLVAESENVDIVCGGAGIGYSERKDLPDYLSCERYLEMQYSRELSAGPWAKLFRRKLFTAKILDESKNVKRAQDYLMNLELAVENKKLVRVFKHSIYYLREHSKSNRHTFVFSLDYCRMLTTLADEIVKGHLLDHNLATAKAKQRRHFFYEAISTNGFLSDANHPYAIETKELLKQTTQITFTDRWLLSVSSPWAVKTVWNLRRMAMRVAHPALIGRDLKRIRHLFLVRPNKNN